MFLGVSPPPLMGTKTEHGEEKGSTEEEDDATHLASLKAPVAPKASWTSLFKGTNLMAKGNSLTFIAPTIPEGKPMAVLDRIYIDKLPAN